MVQQDELRPVQPLLLAAFRQIARRRLGSAFRAVRLAGRERFPVAEPGVARIVYTNHPSWWDPLMAIATAPDLIGGAHFYAPMDAAALARYRLFKRMGLFPVEMGTPRGAAQFLRTAEQVLRRGHVLALTAQGAMTDARVRPPSLKNGLATLLHRLERSGRRAVAIPVALEYTFWDQRLPEALLLIGEPVRTGKAASSVDAYAALVEARLAEAQDELAALSLKRDAGPFRTLLEGRRGAGGVYGFWERMRRDAGGRRGLDHRAR